MPVDFQKLVELKKVREDIDNLSEYERRLSSPAINDVNLLSRAYDIFKEIMARRDCPPRVDSVTQRKKFLFIALYLFSPGVLIGDCMPKGFRAILSRVLGIKSHTLISNNCDDVVFLYQNYKGFSDDVEDIYEEISARLQELG